MKRAILVGTGTVAGVAAVLALNPDAGQQAIATTSVAHSSTGSSGSSGSSGGTAPSAPAANGSASSATGSAVDVGYGTVQVEISVKSGRIVDITALALPDRDPRSSSISQQAFPMLVQQALSAQSADIAGVSGASYTSYGFVESLKAAMAQAGI